MLKWNKILSIIIAIIEALFPFIQDDDEKKAEQEK